MSDHVKKITENISNEIALRKVRNAERAEKLRLSRTTGDFLLPENIEKEFQRRKQEPTFDDLVGKFTRGEHLFRNVAKEELLDLERESRLAFESAAVIHNHYAGTSDDNSSVASYESSSISGKMRRLNMDDISSASISKSRETVSLFQNAHKKKMETIRLRTHIGDMEDESEKIMCELDEAREANIEDTFDWQIEKQDRLRELRENITTDKIAMEATKVVDNLKSHPYLSSYIRIAGEVDNDEKDEPDEDDDEEATNINDINMTIRSGASSPSDAESERSRRQSISSSFVPQPVKAWFLGKLTKEGDLSSIIFGQFLKDILPPEEGWIYVGHLMQKHRVPLMQTQNSVYAATGTNMVDASIAENSLNNMSSISFNASAEAAMENENDGITANAAGGIRTVGVAPPYEYDNEELVASMRKSHLSVIPMKQIDMSLRTKFNASRGSTAMDMSTPLPMASPVPLSPTTTAGVVNIDEDEQDDELGPAQFSSTLMTSSVMSVNSSSSNAHLTVSIPPTPGSPSASKYSMGSLSTTTRAYAVTGSSFESINGRYLLRGTFQDHPKYMNQSGWCIFRVSLNEIPELGIFADSCYDALKGPSVLELLEKKSKRAFKELVNKADNRCLEGTIQFRHRFGELVRFGTKSITADQINQIIRNENLKAQMRSESDEAMLVMLQALADSNPENVNGSNNNSTSNSGYNSSTNRSPSSKSPAAITPLVSTPREDEDADTPRRNRSSKSMINIDNSNKGIRSSSPFGSSNSTPVKPLSKQRSVKFANNNKTGADGLDSTEGSINNGPSKLHLTLPESQPDRPGISLPGFPTRRESKNESQKHRVPGAAVLIANSARANKENNSGSKPKSSLQAFTGVSKGSSVDAVNDYSADHDLHNNATNPASLAADTLTTGVMGVGDSGAQSESELRTKVVLAHNIEYQETSPALLMSKDMYFRAKESELAAVVIATIEEREALLFSVRIESEKIQRKYLDQVNARALDHHGESDIGFALSAGSGNFDMMSEFIKLVRALRECSIRVVEAIGAWIRLCKLEKAKRELGQRKIAAHSDSKRTYCVTIAKKGSIIIPPSQPVDSTSIFFKRGREPEVNATDMEFIGVFDNREDAVLAFDMAIARVPTNKQFIGEADNGMCIGLRYCGKHYLVRSHRVPADLPCEVCASRTHAVPDSVVPLLTDPKRRQDSDSREYNELLPQFIWKGKKYLDKMWMDTSFLSENVFIKAVLPNYLFAYNPLLLDTENLRRTLEILNVEHDRESSKKITLNKVPGKSPTKNTKKQQAWSAALLDSLKGQTELTSDAVKTGLELITEHVPGRWDHWGLVYRPGIHKYLNAAIGNGTDDASTVSSILMSKTMHVSIDDYKTVFTELEKKEKARRALVTANAKRARSAPSLPFHATHSMEYSGNQQTEEGGRSSPSRAGTQRRPFSSASNGRSGFSFDLFADDKCTDERIFRSLTIMGQASSFARSNLASEIRPKKPHKLSEATQLEMEKLRKMRYNRLRGISSGENTTTMLAREEESRQLLAAILNSGDASVSSIDFSGLGFGGGHDKSNVGDGYFAGSHSHAQNYGDDSRDNDMIPTSRSGDSGHMHVNTRFGISSDPKSAFGRPNLINTYYYNNEVTQYVNTKYGHMGASLAIIQTRQPIAYRVADIWCRSDVGEWAGLTKGRAMRSFEFQDNLVLQGRQKTKERKLLQDKMRKSIDVSFVDCDVSLIQSLVKEAKATAKVVLGLDILALENYLRRRVNLIKGMITLQSISRGNHARKLYKVLKQQHAIFKLREKLTKRFAQELSVVYIPPIVQKVVAAQVKRQMKLLLWTTAQLSDVRVVISVHQLSRNSKKGFDFADISGDNDKLPVLCPACETKCLWQRKNVVTSTVASLRSICTCQQVQCSERWLFKVFNPLTCETIERIFEMTEMQELMASLHRTVECPPSWRVDQLRASDDMMLSLVLQWYKGTGRDGGQGIAETIAKSVVKGPHQLANLKTSAGLYFKALLHISKESSALFRLPHTFSEFTLNSIYMGSLLRKEFPYNPISTSASRSILNVDAIELSKPILNDWEPILDYRRCLKQVEDAYVKLQDLQYRTDIAKVDLQLTDAERYERVGQLLDRSLMEYEDSRSTLVRTQDILNACTDQIQAVMKFQMDMFEDFLSHEQDEKEDWAQSWEKFEDGGAWEGLNNKRKLEKVLLQHRIAFAHQNAELQETLVVVAKADAVLNNAINTMNHMTAQLIEWMATMNRLGSMTTFCRSSIREVLCSVVSSMSLPLRLRMHPKPRVRRLEQVDFSLVTERNPLERTRKQFRAAWKGVFRAVLPLHSSHDIINSGLTYRAVVEIFKDPITGYYVVHFSDGRNGEPSVTEEATQHEDINFPKHTFSVLTTGCCENEIVFAPQDVKRILAKTPFWPNKPPTQSAMPTKSSRGYNTRSLNMLESVAKATASVMASESNPTSAQSNAILVERDVPLWRNRKVFQRPPKYSLRQIYSCNRDIGNPHNLLVDTFQQRRQQEDDKELDLAKRLASYIRVQCHTGRPTLGLEHFHRRFVHFSDTVKRSLWYQDLQLGRSASWCNQVYKKYKTEVSNEPAKTTIQIFLRHVEIRLIAGNKMSEVQVPVNYLFHRMAERPLLFMSFLTEMIVNRFSYDSMAFILDQLDLQLPGGGPRLARWRAAFPTEVPAIKFLLDRNDKYRGPPFIIHRFIMGKYFKAKFLTTVSEDLKIELSVPTDGNFWAHTYEGETVNCYITQDELRAFVANASSQSKLVSDELKYSVDLLRMEHRHELFNLLLDALILDPDILKGDEVLSWKQLGGYWRPEPVLKDVVRQCFRDFNSWTQRTSGRIDAVSDSDMAIAYKYIDELTARPKWKLDYHKDKPKRRLVEVHSGIWSVADIDNYHGADRNNDSLMQLILGMRTPDGVPGFMFRGHKIPLSYNNFVGGRQQKDDNANSRDIVSSFSSYWTLRFLTDESKDGYHIELRPAQVSENLTAQKFLSQKEQEKMTGEDEYSRKARSIDKLFAEQCVLSKKMQQLQQLVTRKFRPQLETLMYKKEIIRRFAVSSRNFLLEKVQHWLVRMSMRHCDTVLHCVKPTLSRLGVEVARKLKQESNFRGCITIPITSRHGHQVTDYDIQSTLAKLLGLETMMLDGQEAASRFDTTVADTIVAVFEVPETEKNEESASAGGHDNGLRSSRRGSNVSDQSQQGAASAAQPQPAAPLPLGVLRQLPVQMAGSAQYLYQLLASATNLSENGSKSRSGASMVSLIRMDSSLSSVQRFHAENRIAQSIHIDDRHNPQRSSLPQSFRQRFRDILPFQRVFLAGPSNAEYNVTNRNRFGRTIRVNCDDDGSSVFFNLLEPSMGPFDIVGAKLYNPEDFSVWKLVITRSECWSEEDVSVSGGATNDASAVEAAMARQCAQHVVSTALLRGCINASAHALGAPSASTEQHSQRTKLKALGDGAEDAIESHLSKLSNSIERVEREVAELKQTLMSLKRFGKPSDEWTAKEKKHTEAIRAGEIDADADFEEDEDEPVEDSFEGYVDTLVTTSGSSSSSSRKPSGSHTSNSGNTNLHRAQSDGTSLYEHHLDTENPNDNAHVKRQHHQMETMTRRQSSHPCGSPDITQDSVEHINNINRGLAGNHRLASKYSSVVYAIVVPADETISFVPLVVNYHQWQHTCKEYIADGEIHRYVRTITLSGLIFCAHRHDLAALNKTTKVTDILPNSRINQWNFEYQAHLGWRKHTKEVTRMARLRVKDHAMFTEHIPTIYGDCIVLLRYGKIDFEKMKAWLTDKNLELKQQKELRRRQQLGVRNARLLNHAAFRENVCKIARDFVPSLERLFNGKHEQYYRNHLYVHTHENGSVHGSVIGSVHSQSHASVHSQEDAGGDMPRVERLHCRLFLSAFAHLRAGNKLADDNISKQVHSVETLDQAFLIDSNPVEVDDQLLLRFRLPPQTYILTEYLQLLERNYLDYMQFRQSIDGDDDMANHNKVAIAAPVVAAPTDFRPRTGHIMYAIYVIHCFNCTLPTNFCAFPGCNKCRLSAAADARLSTANLEELKGTGLHPLEIRVKEYLLTAQQDLLNSFLPVGKRDIVAVEDDLYTQQVLFSKLNHHHRNHHLNNRHNTILNTIVEGEDGNKGHDHEEDADAHATRALKWTTLREDALRYRYLDRRARRPELLQGMSWSDVITAHSGRHADIDEAAMSVTSKQTADVLLEELEPEEADQFSHYEDFSVDTKHAALMDSKQADKDKSGKNIEGDISNDGRTDPNHYVEVFAIPRTIVSEMLADKRGVDCRGYRIPYKYIDPYPAVSTSEQHLLHMHFQSQRNIAFGQHNSHIHQFRPHNDNHNDPQNTSGSNEVNNGNSTNLLARMGRDNGGRPMASMLCSWLVSRLVLFRPDRLPDEISGDRGQFSTAIAGLKFDRLHLESVTALGCGSLVSMQFLHGILADSSLANDSVSGCPHGSIRYCPMNLLSKLKSGLTISVFDTRSNVSVACSVGELVLARTAAAFKLSESDIPLIAAKLNALAPKVLRLTRVGFRCTAVSLDLESVLEVNIPRPRSMSTVASGKTKNRKSSVGVSGGVGAMFFSPTKQEQLELANASLLNGSGDNNNARKTMMNANGVVKLGHRAVVVDRKQSRMKAMMAMLEEDDFDEYDY
jgi:hypothetical protein